MKLRERQVSEIMNHEIVTLAPDESLDLSDDLMSLGRMRHMPVVENDKLVGIVSRSDLLASSLSRAFDFSPERRRSFLRSITVRDAMTAFPHFVSSNDSVEAVEQLMREHGITDTIVVFGGEFGRTIYSQGKLTKDNHGRDHHGRCV